MCLFSQPVQHVSGTRIFARVVAGPRPRQVLVYAMELGAAQDVAMLLPLPTPKDAPDDAVEFISLEASPGFFDDMARGFPGGASRSLNEAPQAQALEVHAVGAFEASFVPRRADFARLDARFRLPDGVWSQLPCPEDYGFAVFKLKAGERLRVHPLALSFPTRNPRQVFFPTAHLHSGEWERRAVFDHTLYFQGSPDLRLPLAFDTGTNRLGRLAGQVLGVQGGAKAPESSYAAAKEFMPEADPRLVEGELKVHRFTLRERLPNRDVVLWPKYHERAGEYA